MLAPVAGNGDLSVPVHDNFVTWFTWSFANQLCFFGMPIIGLLVACINGISESLGKCFGGLISCGFCCSGLIAWIMGMVWRFSEAGKYASGDYVLEGE